MPEEILEKEAPKKRSSPLFLLPIAVLKKINEAIDRDRNISEIQIILKENYKGELRVNSRHLIKKYIELYKIETKELQETNKIVNETADVKKDNVQTIKTTLSSDWDLNDKKKILEDLIKECKCRIDRLKSLPAFEVGPGTESALQKYVSEVREIIKILLQLSGELNAEQNNKVVINLVNDNLFSIMQVVAKTVKSVYGSDKILIFKEQLKENFLADNKGFDIKSIDAPKEDSNGEKKEE